MGQLCEQAPEEPDPWENVFEADELGNVCHQPPWYIQILHPFWNQFDEDCLNINIFMPYVSLNMTFIYICHIKGTVLRLLGIRIHTPAVKL